MFSLFSRFIGTCNTIYKLVYLILSVINNFQIFSHLGTIKLWRLIFNYYLLILIKLFQVGTLQQPLYIIRVLDQIPHSAPIKALSPVGVPTPHLNVTLQVWYCLSKFGTGKWNSKYWWINESLDLSKNSPPYTSHKICW